MRDRLIDLIVSADISLFGTDKPYAEVYADYLLANGVIVPPFKVGDKVYYITGLHDKVVKEAKIEELYYNGDGFAYRVSSDYLYFDMQAEEVFLTREEAEAKLKEGVQG